MSFGLVGSGKRGQVERSNELLKWEGQKGKVKQI